MNKSLQQRCLRLSLGPTCLSADTGHTTTARVVSGTVLCRAERKVKTLTSFAGFVAVSSTNFIGLILPSSTPLVNNNGNLVSTPGIPFGINLNEPILSLANSDQSTFISVSRRPSGYECECWAMVGSCSSIPLILP